MIRSSPSWALSQLASPESRCVVHCQRRFKTFVRRVDKNDQIYYTVAKRGPSQNPDQTTLQSEFFEMPDLLLDLDAEGSRHVRSSDEVDEERMRVKWEVIPERIAIQARVKEFEEQLSESRRKVNDILSHPTNIWRLTSHDVLSTALHGAPRDIEEARVGEKGTEAPQNSETSDNQRVLGIIETLRSENGIPSHAAENDQLLLEWMMLRQKGLEHSKKFRREEPPSPKELSKALRNQTSITGIRRLVFRALASGVDESVYAKQLGFDGDSGLSPNISREIRDACLRVLGQCPEDPSSRIETLTFLGNLAGRLSQHDGSIGAALCGLALRLSADAGIVGATSEWLYRGYADDIWNDGVESSEDVFETLQTYIKFPRNTSQSGLHSTQERQHLFQLLTGIDETHLLTSDSFRALAMHYLHESKVPIQQAFSIYESYIMLLGHLGAIRTLWKEGQVSAPHVDKLLKKRKVPGNVETLFHAASVASLRVTAPPVGEDSPDLSLDECVTLDYHSIALQNPDTWLEDAGEAATSSNTNHGAAIGDIGPALSLPLNEWLRRVEKLVQRKATTG